MDVDETVSRSRWWAAVLVVLAPAWALAAPPAVAAANTAASTQATSRSSFNAADAVAPSIRISYRDLDIKSPEGIATLYVRIRRAASELCDAGRAPIGSRLVNEHSERCVRTTIAATVKQIGVPGLAMLDAEQRALGEPAGVGRPSCAGPEQPKIII